MENLKIYLQLLCFKNSENILLKLSKMDEHFIAHFILKLPYMTFGCSKPHNYFCTFSNGMIQIAYENRLLKSPLKLLYFKNFENILRSEEHTSELQSLRESRMPSSA